MGTLPDGTLIRPLMPLKDRKCSPKKDKMHPGYPNFIEGKFGESPMPPNGEVTNEPTLLERANFVEHAVPVPFIQILVHAIQMNM